MHHGARLRFQSLQTRNFRFQFVKRLSGSSLVNHGFRENLIFSIRQFLSGFINVVRQVPKIQGFGQNRAALLALFLLNAVLKLEMSAFERLIDGAVGSDSDAEYPLSTGAANRHRRKNTAESYWAILSLPYPAFWPLLFKL